MGLGNVFLNDLIELKQKGALDGATRVMEIGAQQISDSLMIAPGLPEAYRLFGCTSPPVLTPVGTENFTKSAPSSAPFWSALGFARSAIDVEGDAIRIDLNRGKVPRRLRGAFDLVVNAGTTEHVANQMNAFRIIHHLVRVGGIMYHELPAGGLIDHGLVGYQPKFFNMLANFNGYEALYIRFTAWGPAKIPGLFATDESVWRRLRHRLQHPGGAAQAASPAVCLSVRRRRRRAAALADHPAPDTQEPVAAQVAPGRQCVSSGRFRVTKGPARAGLGQNWPDLWTFRRCSATWRATVAWAVTLTPPCNPANLTGKRSKRAGSRP